VRRSNELRRRRVAIDRRVAFVAVALGAIVLACTVGVARAPAPAPVVNRPDPAAARELVALMRAGEGASWLVTYDFTRTLPSGSTLRQVMREGRTPALHVLYSGTAMTVDRGSQTYVCNLVDDRSSCDATPGGRALPASEVLRVAVSVGAYAVRRLPERLISGQPSGCFRVFATGSATLPDLGTDTDMCLFADGVPSSQRISRTTGVVDERVARSVKRGVPTSAIEALERSFGPAAARKYP
jgi:hypothetical protein